MQNEPSKTGAVIVTPEEAEAIRPFGLDMQVLLGSEQTGGRLSVIMACHRPGEGPPDHLHFTQEECFFIVEGTYEVTAGDTTRTVGAGAIVYLPRGVVHRFRNVGTTTARMLDWSVPGGQDRYFREISALAGPGFSGEKVALISEKHDTNFPAPH
ncbi:Cupin domain-containing protein [Variovorax sp. PDC80]|jgi:mannose-6-phosphate isomerase-like protein (cupin superfamily)|uniref:cupin domain-containing protein n=1 Tax=Variovorax sp. PDC80 TaxID=1882827 RepID=UPI0008E6C2FD|nr:cupin domain-containing protein [Variovorax sp. PDC80]SFP79651.1 Cupin domain-containing protein [Variovorax sp. PDC80]